MTIGASYTYISPKPAMPLAPEGSNPWKRRPSETRCDAVAADKGGVEVLFLCWSQATAAHTLAGGEQFWDRIDDQGL